MKVGVIGSRRRNTKEDYALVLDAFRSVNVGEVSIVSGGCPLGGDRFAEQIAANLRIPIKIFPADWRTYGPGAGFRRNGDIAAESDILIACVSKDRTGGTEDTIRKFKRLKPEGRVILV